MSDDSLHRVRAGIDAAHEAAEQIVAEAEARARASFDDLPPAGWAAPGAGQAPGGGADLRALVALLDGLRDLVRDAVPPELTARVASAVRELLVAVRALLDFYIERIERPTEPSGVSAGPSRVHDIPIE